ncbi:MAG: aldose 1-epimerase family protein [Planctomycetota bacterium]
MHRDDIIAHCGNEQQHGGIRRYRLDDGPGLGQRVWEVHEASGWLLQLLPDRGLDCAAASWRGENLAWLSLNGLTDPAAYDPVGIGWLRSFTGGLLTTCGPTHFGPPCNDAGEDCGLHGRFHVSPARSVNGSSDWSETGLVHRVSGIIEEARLFGHRLRIERSWRLAAGAVELHDRIRNDADAPAPLCLLYHCNFGWPLLGPATRLEGAIASTEPRDEAAAAALAEVRSCHAPQAGFAEQVFFHTPESDPDGWAHMQLINAERGLRVGLSWDASTLPALTQWRCLGHGAYVCGLEPGTAFVRSRAELRARGELPTIAPGEERLHRLRFSVEHI